MKSLSCQQRNYFIDRIKESINKEIGVLEQMHATKIETVANKQFKVYMKETGIGKLMAKYKKRQQEYKKLEDRMSIICTSLWEKTEYPGKPSYKPSWYNPEGMESFLKEVCNSLARDGFINTPKGRRLGQLEQKRAEAIDIVMGMTDTEPTVAAINKVLKGTKIPLIGAGK
mgnify:CR=1 FL=1